MHWDVLEQQLFLSRLGGDERRRDVFQRMLRRGHEEARQWREGGDRWRADVCLSNLRAAGANGHVQSQRPSSKEELGSDLSDEEGSAVSVAVCAADSSCCEDLQERHASGGQLQGQRSHQPPVLWPAGGQWQARRGHRAARKFSPSPETLVAMRQVLDLATHLCYYPAPIDTGSAIFVAAKDDLYIPRQSVTDVRHLWPGDSMSVFCLLSHLSLTCLPPGCTVRYVDGGHVSSTVLKQADYR